MGTIPKKEMLPFRPEMVKPLKDIIAMVDTQHYSDKGDLVEGKSDEYILGLVATIHWLSTLVYWPEE